MKFSKPKFLTALVCLLVAYNTEAAVLRLEQESTTTPDDLATTTTAATTSDDEATVRIAVASLDPAPGTFDDVELHLDVDQSKLAKSANLLLLSTPKLIGKREEVAVEEENVEEIESAGTQDTTTTPPMDAETTTMATGMDDETTELNKAATTNTQGTTKLFAVNETFVNSNHEQSARIVAVETLVMHNDNAAATVLTEHEADYLLVDADVESEIEEFGSFTHADSEVHLQPIVQSVEIVPTSFDDPLIINFVQQL